MSSRSIPLPCVRAAGANAMAQAAAATVSLTCFMGSLPLFQACANVAPRSSPSTRVGSERSPDQQNDVPAQNRSPPNESTLEGRNRHFHWCSPSALVNQVLHPTPPAVGELRNRKQPRHLMAIARVDAKDIADADVVIRLFDNRNRVSRAHVTLDDDSQVGSGPHSLAEPARKHLVVHPHSQPPAGNPGLGHLESGTPDSPALSDERVIDFDAFRSEVLPERAI